jgi:predicted 3-demethylubiquinone-9 3-methyltransferase (glyoxalase superfamily)
MDSRVKSATTLDNTPSGSVDVVSGELRGQEYTLVSAGPLFKLRPSVSFHAACATKYEVDTLWRTLLTGGSVLMELGAYPFSERHGWVQDRYGLSRQIVPTIMETKTPRRKEVETSLHRRKMFERSLGGSQCIRTPGVFRLTVWPPYSTNFDKNLLLGCTSTHHMPSQDPIM